MYSSKQAIIDAIQERLKKCKSLPKRELLDVFAQRFFNSASLIDLNDRGVDELTSVAEELWTFIASRSEEETKVRIYNPDAHSSHTVIQVACKDMPFIVDSVRMEINRYGFLVHFIIHVGGLLVQRDEEGLASEIYGIGAYDENACSEAIMHIEIDRQSDDALMQEMQSSILSVLKDVKASVDDWLPMRQKLHQSLMELERNNLPLDPAEIAESRDFLRWLDSDHFTFLGYREYEKIGEGNEQALKILPDSGLGVLRDSSHSQVLRPFADMPEQARNQILSSNILIIAKTNTRSTVHRPVHTDYIGVKRFNEHGELIGECRFIGLYTSVAYSSNPKHIPFLRHKVSKVMQLSGLPANGHAGKALLHILETIPRDDLFQATPDELLEISLGILHLQERQRVRLFMRKDYYGRYYSCYVYVPRERYNTTLRKRLEAILEKRLLAIESSFSTSFTDSVLARMHFVMRIDPKSEVKIDVDTLEKELVEASRSWNDNFYDYLAEAYGEAQAVVYFNKYKDAFPEGYKEYYNPYTACRDVLSLEGLDKQNPLDMAFYRSVFKGNNVLRLKLFNLQTTMALSDVLPLLENMGLRVIAERPNEIVINDQSAWINDCDLIYTDDEMLNVEDVKDIFKQAFEQIWEGEAENDGFNRLVLKAGLSAREVVVFRAYAKYMQQIQFTYSQAYIESTLDRHSNIVRLMIVLFHQRFNPDCQERNTDDLIKQIEEALDDVVALDEDRILRRYLELIMATMRTNYYQVSDGRVRSYVSFKLAPDLISEMPLPRPMYEIFVYSPRVEGVHLRSSKVARGGLRWSDRREDFRVEVLGLMKAQAVKNSVIVPSGAKGGFYPKQLPDGDREAIFNEGHECYKIFIRGLLDITDNLVKGQLVPPVDVVSYDDEDSYLVVAADKGTATFSDTANAISEEYGFWLGDAFASGGSTGYDHKKMGITARGAWESVKRHFRGHFNFNTQEEEFTVVGIGDMSGDVFGNGMLCSDKIRLVAAFNHLHIFIDPNPNAARSFKERQRLFQLSRSTWADYDETLISQGGGVFSRKDKFIELTPEIKELFDIEEDRLIPTDLIKAVLKAKVDLLWNGGIGTYVKSKSENHLDVGDRVNDAVRVNGSELRCRVIGEGGNLGCTQLGRIEYSLNKGIMYTDFVDNSAGVDCSDTEVNIKILLNSAVESRKLNVEQRNELLASMTDDVAKIVLRHNYNQTQAISFSEARSIRSIDAYRRVMRNMEKNGKLNRELEFLPSNKTITERKAKKQGLTNPEISVLYSYTKNILKEEIINSGIPEEDCFSDYLLKGFPEVLQKKYLSFMQDHPLRREIIATQLANQLVNRMGVNFLERVRRQTGASMPDIVRAYVLSARIFNLDQAWADIESLDYKVDSHVQFEMLNHAYHLMRRSIRWFLKNHKKGINVTQALKYYSKSVQEYKEKLPALLLGRDQDKYESISKHYRKQKISDEMANKGALNAVLFSVLDVVTAANEHKQSIESLINVSYRLSSHLELDWLRRQIASKELDNLWDETARYNLLDDIDKIQCQLALNVLNMKPSRKTLEAQFNDWLTLHEDHMSRWKTLLDDLKSIDVHDFTMFTVSMRILSDIMDATKS